jgi:hypothetical protein
MWTIFCCLNGGIVTLAFHLEHIAKLNVGIACFTPKSQYTFCDFPLDIAMDITLHMKFTILMWVLHQIFVLLKILYMHYPKIMQYVTKKTQLKLK